MNNELKRRLIESINHAEKSTKAMREAFPVEMHDRVEASMLLHELKAAELIYKQGNGYWKTTLAGRKWLENAGQEMKEVPSDAETTIDDTPGVSVQAPSQALEANSETVGTPSPNDPLDTEIDLFYTSDIPSLIVNEEISEPYSNSNWRAISDLSKQLPAGASIVIEEGFAMAVFAGGRFRLSEPGDIEAMMRMAERFEGSAA